MYKPIPEDTIKQILNQVDLVEVVGDYVHLKKSGKNHVGLCPFHSEKTPSFSVSSDKQFYHCFGCGAGGNAFSFLMEMEGHTFRQAVAYLGEKSGIQIDLDEFSDPHEKGKQADQELVLKAHNLSTQLFHHMLTERSEGEKALAYVHQRGFTDETIKTFQLGYAPDSWDFLTSFLNKREFPMELMEKGGLIAKKEGENRYYDRFRGRIIFPIWNRQGQVIAFQGRVLGKGEPKYLNSPETSLFLKNRQLFNFHRARKDIRQKQTALLFEGCADVLTAHQSGITFVTATLGTALSEEQGRMIARNAEQVILCYDSDSAGHDATKRAAEILARHQCIVKVGMLPQGYDPDEYIKQYGAAAFEAEVIGGAKSFTAFQLQSLRRNRNLRDDSERMAYIRDALQVISRLNQAVERDHYVRQLADEFSLSLDALKQQQHQIYIAEKKQTATDKGPVKWNNSKNNGKHLVGKKLLPAHQMAEKILLAHMLKDSDVAQEVEERVGSSFHFPEHSALAAYLYSYYAQGNTPGIGHFLTKLTDSKELMTLATDLSAMTIGPETEREIDDLIIEIQKYPYHIQIDKKIEEKNKAEQHGDMLTAAKIAMEVVNMEKQLKSKLFFQESTMFRKEGE